MGPRITRSEVPSAPFSLHAATQTYAPTLARAHTTHARQTHSGRPLTRWCLPTTDEVYVVLIYPPIPFLTTFYNSTGTPTTVADPPGTPTSPGTANWKRWEKEKDDGDNELINGDPDPPSAPAAADTHVVRSRGVHWTIGAEGQMRARAAA